MISSGDGIAHAVEGVDTQSKITAGYVGVRHRKSLRENEVVSLILTSTPLFKSIARQLGFDRLKFY